MTRIHHKESDLQIRCVKWFRITYPAFARLLEHPKNEGDGHSAQDRMRQAISKAEGVQAGVADLILHVPSNWRVWKGEIQEEPYMVYSLAIEMKTKTGRQSPEQKIFARYFEAAGGQYEIVRTFEDFQKILTAYMDNIPCHIWCAVNDTYDQLEREKTEAARAELKRIINKA